MSLLEEIKDVRQRPEEGYRRWFSNEYFDLVLWYDKRGGDITGVQFCYGKPYSEKAFTWEGRLKSHHYVTDVARAYSGTGMLTGNAGVIPPHIKLRFCDEAAELDDWITKIVLEKIDEFNRSQ